MSSLSLKHSMRVRERERNIALNGLFALESSIPKFNESLPMYVE